MRHVILGTSHHAHLVAGAVRELDPAGIIVIIDRSQEAAQALSELVRGRSVPGDPMDPRVLEKAEVDKADTFIAASDSDALNIRASEVAKKEYKIPIVIAVLNNPSNSEEALARGADYVISPASPLKSHVKAILAMDSWVKATTPEFFGIDLYLYRAVKTSVLGISLSQIREELKGLEALVVCLTKMGSIIRDPSYELREGDVIAIVSPRGAGEQAVERVRRLISRIQRIRAEAESGRVAYP